MFRDFSSFEIEDFAFDESFQKWVADSDSDHSDFWRRYMNEHPHQIDKILAARELVLELRKEDSGSDRKDLADSIWTNISGRMKARERSWFQRPRRVYIAASVALLITAGYSFFRLYPPDRAPEYQSFASDGTSGQEVYMEQVNKGDKVLTILLDDGSIVNLEKNSSLRYPGYFRSKERIVHLRGEAFFDVEKDPSHPFLVFTGKTVVKVLGTSFRVKAHEDSAKVVVAVKTGKVSVFEKKEFEKVKENPQLVGLVLMANQQAEFSNDLEKFSKILVPDPVILGGTNKKEFDFDRTPLPKVFSTLEKAYGIEIIYDRDLLADRLLKVSLEDETLTEKLDVICRTMGLSYHIVDARIIIEVR